LEYEGKGYETSMYGGEGGSKERREFLKYLYSEKANETMFYWFATF
jgi:hypothetical protein